MIGRSEQITLLDEIHLVAMVAIFAIALAGVQAQRLFDRGVAELATQWDIRALWITSLTYIVINLALVWSAATLA